MRVRDDARVFAVLVDGETWTETFSLANADSEDRVFTVDSMGTVVFGDGTHGQRPRSGAEVTVSYRQGGGEAGNVQITVASPWPPPTCGYLVAVNDQGFQIRAVDNVVDHCSGEKRLRYFYGQLLTASDFQDEQQYHLQMSRRHNKLLHGPGIVIGLELNVSGGTTSPLVVVSPGYAIDTDGKELILVERIALQIGNRQSPQYVTIKHTEKQTDWRAEDGGPTNSWRVEDCLLACLVAEPESCEALTIGRVVPGPSGWDVDRTFQPLKSH
jgi:hypothetical protein